MIFRKCVYIIPLVSDLAQEQVAYHKLSSCIGI